MKPLALILATLFSLPLVGCKEDIKPEQETPTFERFSLSRQETPMGYPNLVLIHDNMTGNEVLVVRGAGSSPDCAVVLPAHGLCITNFSPARP